MRRTHRVRIRCRPFGKGHDDHGRHLQPGAPPGVHPGSRLPQWIPAVFPGELAEYGLVGTEDTIRKRIAAYEEVGVDEFIISFPDVLGLDIVDRFAEAFIA